MTRWPASWSQRFHYSTEVFDVSFKCFKNILQQKHTRTTINQHNTHSVFCYQLFTSHDMINEYELERSESIRGLI